MAPVAGAVASGLIGGSWIAGGTMIFGFSWTAFAGSMIMGGLSYALTPKAKRPSSVGQTSSNTVTVRQSDLTRKHVYGHTRVTTGYAHMEVTGVNKDLHIILMLSEGPLRSINEIWLNDYIIPPDWIDADGNVTQGRYAGKLIVRKHLGALGQPADPLAVTNMSSWTSQHRLDGIAYLYLILTKDQDVYPTGVPNFSAVVEGPYVYDPRDDTYGWTTNMALFSADYLQNPVYGFGIADDDIDMMNVSAQANICDEIVDTVIEDFKVEEIDTDTNIISLDGDILKLNFGDQVTVVSTGTLPGGITSATNYYVIPYQIKDDPRIMLATTLENSMNKVVLDITSAGSGTITVRKNGEPRYHGSGVIETETNLSENLNNLVTAMAGRAVNVGGFWTLLAGAWRSPATSYGIGDLRGSGMSFKNDLSMSESYNVVKGLFISGMNSYQPTDYPSAQYQQFINDDNGIEATKEINLPFTTRPTTAQRIAKIELFRGRQGIVFNSDFSMKAIGNQPGDTVELDIDRLGWSGKEFEITQFSFDVADGNLFCRMTLRETAQQIYDWTDGEAIDFDPAPNTNLPNPYFVQVPTGVSYNSRLIETRDGDELYALTMQWDLHPDLFVTQFGDFEIQYKKSADNEWFPSFFVDGSLTQSDVVNSSVNVYYDLRIRARNNLGVRSQWVYIYNAVVGSSGGVTDTDDWRFYSEAIDEYKDWGLFSDPADSSTEDWGFFR